MKPADNVQSGCTALDLKVGNQAVAARLESAENGLWRTPTHRRCVGPFTQAEETINGSPKVAAETLKQNVASNGTLVAGIAVDRSFGLIRGLRSLAGLLQTCWRAQQLGWKENALSVTCRGPGTHAVEYVVIATFGALLLALPLSGVPGCVKGFLGQSAPGCVKSNSLIIGTPTESG